VEWAEERAGEHRVAMSADRLRRGVARRIRGVARGGGRYRGVRVGPRGGVGPTCVTGGVGAAKHRFGPRATPRRCGIGPIQSSDRPLQPLWGEDRGGGWQLWPAPGQGAGPEPSPPGVVAGRAGTPRHATRGLCGGRGSHSWKGRGPSAVDSTPQRAVSKYPDSGQQGNGLSRSRGDWIRSGAGLFPCGFSIPPTTCLNFSLWRDLSVWRIWGGFFGCRRSGLGGVIDRGDAVPVAV